METLKKPMEIWYDKPAPDNDDGWEQFSLPLGNGYMGVRLFGGVETERLQITETTLWTGGGKSIERHWHTGLENFAELYLDFPHSASETENYRRTLSLDTGVARVEYDVGGVRYTREVFGSYPDKVFAARLSSSVKGGVTVTVRPYSPFDREYMFEEGDGISRSSKVTAEGDTITQSGVSDYYNVVFEGQYKVLHEGGRLAAGDGTVTVTDADTVTVLFFVGTNYRLCPEVFDRPAHEKLDGFELPHEKVGAAISAASAKDFELLRKTAVDDFSSYFSRVSVDLGGTPPDVPTDELKRRYGSGEDKNPYLIELAYQMGRYCLIAISRENCMPPHLQGIWNCFKLPPWSSGFWYNINIQMNYWPVFTSDLPEMFRVFEKFNRVRMPSMQRTASTLIKMNLPEKHTEGAGRDGWVVGTGNNPYNVAGVGGHSGPGTGGLTTQLYWDYYAFTQDKEILRRDVYPMLEGLARFYCKFVEKTPDGKYLCKISSSPEQHCKGTPYVTVGCAFDQQMMYENNRDFLAACEILGDDPVVDKELEKTVREQIDAYDPVLIGWSGQIKEYREENRYGEIIDEPFHRHISHAVGVYPGSIVTSATPHWQDGAEKIIEGRGPSMTGWGKVHRLAVLARTGDVTKCRTLMDKIVNDNVFPNLMSCHNPQLCFQIDSCFGLTAAIAEMLVQSHEGFINVLPTLPDGFDEGSVEGIAARGNFKLSFSWSDRVVNALKITSRSGGTCTVRCPGLSLARIFTADGVPVAIEKLDADTVSFGTEAGETYTFSGIPNVVKTVYKGKLTADASDRANVRLSWTPAECEATYAVYRARGSAPTYEKIGETSDCAFTDTACGADRVTYKVTATEAGKRESRGVCKAVLPEGVPDTGEVRKFGVGDGTFTHW